MLIIRSALQIPAPDKPVFEEQAAAQIASFDFISKGGLSVQIRRGVQRLDDPLTVDELRVRIVQGVDVHGQPEAVL